jgi:GNAT superfamily N-acetyltransferase
MAITITNADLTRDRGLLIETLRRFLMPGSNERRFDWLYKSNPEGLARAWLAVDTQKPAVIGTAAAFPRTFYFGPSPITAWVLGDFCLDPAYRSLGPALQLQRECLTVTKSEGGIFCYDFPNDGMVAVYKRLGFAVTRKMLRFAKLLRVDRRVRAVVKVPIAQAVISAFGNTLLKCVPTRAIRDSSLDISIHEGRCGEEFSDLACDQGSGLGVCIQRSADYLNWRYVSHPSARYEIVTARRHGKLRGYAVWTEAGEDASIVDLFGEDNPAMVKALVSEVIRRLTKHPVTTVSLWLNESHPWISACTDMGFRPRESVPMVCVPGPAAVKFTDVRSTSTRWFLMEGDRDS